MFVQGEIFRASLIFVTETGAITVSYVTGRLLSLLVNIRQAENKCSSLFALMISSTQCIGYVSYSREKTKVNTLAYCTSALAAMNIV